MDFFIAAIGNTNQKQKPKISLVYNSINSHIGFFFVIFNKNRSKYMLYDHIHVLEQMTRLF